MVNSSIGSPNRPGPTLRSDFGYMQIPLAFGICNQVETDLVQMLQHGGCSCFSFSSKDRVDNLTVMPKHSLPIRGTMASNSRTEGMLVWTGTFLYGDCSFCLRESIA